MAAAPTKPIYIFSHARVSSNLFVRVISEHPQLSLKKYAFDEAFMWGPEYLTARRTPEIAENRESQSEENKAMTYQMALDKIVEFIDKTRTEGKVPVLKDHTYYLLDPQTVAANFQISAEREILPTPKVTCKLPTDSIKSDTQPPVVLPPAFLVSLTPVFLIRDPIRFVPSYYKAGVDSIGVRVGDPDWAVNATLKGSRLLYDWYKEQGISPMIIDAKELVHQTENVTKEFCERAGVDKGGVITKWETSKNTSVHADTWFSSLGGSTGIDTSLEPMESNMDEEYKKLAAKWGEEVAEGLKVWVEAAQEDYLYLRRNAVCVGSS
ncbi:hypothetical protein TWF694_005592 [Orbilia ellipsospora]|uniref:Uncharacterized protein n=1 Tax=Orbilia ellipsospora TaxID=2528407 RepID=A0AAV9WTP7_9PEZI